MCRTMTRTRKDAMEEGEHGKSMAPIQNKQPVAQKAPRRKSADRVNTQPAASGSMAIEEAGGTHNDENHEEWSNISDTQGTQSQASHVTNTGKGKKKGAKGCKVWTKAREDKLIEMYEERQFLYNLKVNGYHNRQKRNAALAHIAKEIGVTGT